MVAKESMTFHRFLKYWCPVILAMAFIFWMSTEAFSSEKTSLIFEPLLRFLFPGMSSQTVGLLHGVIRKCGHVTEYFILGVLLFRAFRGASREGLTRKWVILSLIVIVLYAASDEFHQSFVSSRTASPIDVAIDTAGGVLAQIVSAVAHYRGSKRTLSAL